MAPKRKPPALAVFVQEWTLPATATLGSSVRAKGILLEIRARLPWAHRKLLDVRGTVLVLGMPDGMEEDFHRAAAIVSEVLAEADDLPIIPREVEDILTISTSERHRWLKDGRLPSAGTRTIRLRGRAREITFHVFNPRLVEDLLDRDAVATWREIDAETAAENRRRAAAARRLVRLSKATEAAPTTSRSEKDAARPALKGWEEFEREGLLR